MTTTRCFRHSRWIASCADCTAWHLTRLHHHRTGATAPQHPSPAMAA
ncbi:hypothetical protein ACI789_23615 [Geodermatophilus sp. SYSU D00965]